MRSMCIAVGALALLAGATLAQSFVDSFSYPDGTTVPGWTEKRGDWFIKGGRLYVSPMTVFPVHGFITKDGYNLKDTVTEATITYDGTFATIQSGGLVARENGGPTHTNLVMCKVQDSSTSNPLGFDSLWVYEFGSLGISSSRGLTPVSTCRVRFVVVDSTATMYVDVDQDGTWDVSQPHILTGQFGAGDTGCMAGLLPSVTRSSAVDDFALFDAVMTSTGTAAPASTLTLNLRGRMPGAAYQVACSTSTLPGVPLGTRRIPLTPDALMFASLLTPSIFSNFVGSLNGNASATAQIVFPNIPALSGFTFYAGFVELFGGAPLGINSISNDLRITVS